MACCRSTCVAARMRTSTCTVRSLPTGSKLFSCSARSSFACSSSGSSPTSSSNSVPPCAIWKRPARSPRGAGEGALHVAEQLALQQPRGDGRAVERHEGLVRARAPAVDGPREQLLARARLAQQQHRACPSRPPAAPAARARASPGARLRLQHALALAAQLLLQQLRVRVVLRVQPLEGGSLLGVLQRRGQHLAVHLHQVHHRLRVRLALARSSVSTP